MNVFPLHGAALSDDASLPAHRSVARCQCVTVGCHGYDRQAPILRNDACRCHGIELNNFDVESLMDDCLCDELIAGCHSNASNRRVDVDLMTSPNSLLAYSNCSNLESAMYHRAINSATVEVRPDNKRTIILGRWGYGTPFRRY